MNTLITEVNQRDETETIMNIVIKSIRAIYPAWRTTIKSQVELDNMKREWLIAFQENNINTDVKINRGLSKARKDTNPFLPSVGQFIQWCKVPHESHVEFKGIAHMTEKVTKERIQQIKAMSEKELKLI